MKTKTFAVTLDFEGVSDITNRDIKNMFDYFMEYSIWAETYGISNIKVATTVDAQEV